MLTLTRETKVGLVVAGSFLCLVAVVVLARLRNGGILTGDQTSPEQTASAETKTPAPESPKMEPVTQVPDLKPAPQPAGGQVVQTGGATTEPPKPTAPDPLAPLPPPGSGPAPREPMPTPEPVAPPPIVAPVAPVNPEPQPAIQPPSDLAPPPATPAPEAARESSLLETLGKLLGTPAKPAPSPTPPAAPAPPKNEDPAPVVPPSLVPPAGGNSDPAPASSPAPPAPATPAPPAVEPIPMPVADPAPKKEPTNDPAIRKPTPPKPDTPVPTPMPTPEVPAPREEPARPAAPREEPRKPAAPRLDATPSSEPTAPAVPVSRPAEPTSPQVESWPEDIIIWKETDSFKSVSKKHYLTDIYGLAIFEYNRNHPLAAPGLRKNPPVLSPGEKLFLPPIAILEREHPAAISKRADLEPTPTPVASSTAVPGKEKYRVGGAGEMYWDIAKRTGANWMDIYLLNGKRFPSEQPIPAGTVLTMPANARVPPENRP